VIAVLTMLVFPTLVFPISTNLISQRSMCVREVILREGSDLRKIQSTCERHDNRSMLTASLYLYVHIQGTLNACFIVCSICAALDNRNP
jgi:hypothetical protein